MNGGAIGSETVLVIGDDTRSFLAIARSLARLGLRVLAAPYRYDSPALVSSALSGVRRLPPYLVDADAWADALAAIVAEDGVAAIYPCDDRAIIPLRRFRDRFAGVRLALPNEEAYQAFFDKHATRETATRAGVPVARGRLLRDDDTAAGLAAEFGAPLVVKPRRSYEEENVAQRGAVVIARSEEEIAALLAERPNRERFLVEEKHPGFGLGMSILAKDGVAGPIFQHHRVHEPPKGGGSSYRVSAEPDPELVRYVEAIARETRLDGVAMFEFKRDPETGATILIEVNGRFWGSLPLAVFAGVDFPALLHRQMASGEAAQRVAYRAPVFARDVIADFYCVQLHLKEAARRGALPFAGKLAAVVGGALRPLWLAETHDSFAWDDPAPAFAEYRLLSGSVGSRLSRGARRGERRAAARRIDAARARLNARDPRRPLDIVFLCFGNICRSPYAADALRQRIAPRAGAVRIRSAGLLPIEGRRSPDDAIAAAAARGVDLTDHRSRHLGPDELAAADLVVVFDEKNEKGLAEIGLAATTPTVRIGDVARGPDAPGAAVEDPYGGPPEAFDACYARLDRLADALADFLAAEAMMPVRNEMPYAEGPALSPSHGHAGLDPFPR